MAVSRLRVTYLCDCVQAVTNASGDGGHDKPVPPIAARWLWRRLVPWSVAVNLSRGLGLIPILGLRGGKRSMLRLLLRLRTLSSYQCDINFFLCQVF